MPFLLVCTWLLILRVAGEFLSQKGHRNHPLISTTPVTVSLKALCMTSHRLCHQLLCHVSPSPPAPLDRKAFKGGILTGLVHGDVQNTYNSVCRIEIAQ